MNTPYSLLTSSATLKTPTYAKDSSGIDVATYASSSFTIACALQPMSGSEAVQYGRETGTTLYRLLMAPISSSGGTYKLTHDMQVLVDGVNYLAVEDMQDVAGKGVLNRAVVERVT